MRKLAYLLILFFCWGINVHAQDSKPSDKIISYKCIQKPLKEILNEVIEQTDINISYNDNVLPVDSLITINVQGRPLGTLLKQLLKQTNSTFADEDDGIVIFSQADKEKEEDDANEVEEQKENQDEITISGKIEDLKSLERLVYANIVLDDRSQGTISNEYGFYSFTIPKGSTGINFTYLGYNSYRLSGPINSDTTLNIKLDPEILLNEVLIVDKRIIKNKDRDIGSIDILPLDKIQSIVSLGGEADIRRLAYLMPGVTTGGDGMGGMNVRGGSVDQNLILFDGVPVYNANHALGIFSVFNSNTIKSAKLYKGGFPARYGGRLSSVLDVRTKDGNKKEIAGDVTIGLLTMKATIEGPIVKEKSSFILSARRTFLDPWFKAGSQYLNDNNDRVGSTNYRFYDWNAKVDFNLSDKTQLLFSYLSGGDKFTNASTRDLLAPSGLVLTDEKDTSWDWGNNVGVVQLNTEISSKAFLNINTYYSDYKFDSFDLNRFRDYDEDIVLNDSYNAGIYRSSVKDIGIKFNLDYLPNSRNSLKIGAGVVKHNFSPGLFFVSTIDRFVQPDEELTSDKLEGNLDGPETNGYDIQSYIENEIKINTFTRLNLGFYSSLIKTKNTTFFLPQPRANLTIGSARSYINTSVSWTSQYLHLLSNSGLGVPADLWLPSTDALKPQTGLVFSTGVGTTLAEDKEIKVDVYYKKMNDIIAFNQAGIFSITSTNNWEESIPQGKGRSYGAEFSFNKNVGQFNWFTNYTLSWSFRQFDQLNSGKEFFARYDRRHSLKISTIYHINESAEFTFNWLFASGNRVTNPIGYRQEPLEDGTIDLLLIYGDKNNVKLDAYHRLDLGFNLYNKFSWGRQKISIGVFNAYNRKNPYFIDIERNTSSNNGYTFKKYTILPLLPSVSYSLSF